MRYIPISISKEGLANHQRRLGYDPVLWRKLVGPDPTKPIASVASITRVMGLKSRRTTMKWLEVDAKTITGKLPKLDDEQ